MGDGRHILNRVQRSFWGGRGHTPLRAFGEHVFTIMGAIYSRGERRRRTHNRGQKDAQQILERSTHAPTKFHIGYAQCTLKDQK